MEIKKKIFPLYVVYHCTNFVPFETFEIFINNYKKYSKNYHHKLLICFKNLNAEEIKKYEKELKKINYIKFIDALKINDFDLGSYKRISEKYKNAIFIFLNGHSYPVINNWIKILMKHYQSDKIVATAASLESMRDLPFNLRNNLIKNIYQKILFYINFPGFPNAHFRTTGFVISSTNFLKYPFPKIREKNDVHLIESGNNSMYKFFKKLKIETLVVNADGKKFNEKNWMKSETYAYRNQKKKIISDNRTRKFDKLSKALKLKKQLSVWGKK
jgi:hypothetical protein